jgi:hypothetical protein
MKTFDTLLVSVFLSLTLINSRVFADVPANHSELLWGQWKFSGMIFQGNWMPPRDERLDLRYEFTNTGESRLAWSYDNWANLCERRGIYFLEDVVEAEKQYLRLVDRTLWVNPNNRDDCSQDPDMQMDRENRSPVRIQNSKLQLDLPFGEDTLTYEWQLLDTAAIQ